MAKGKMHMDITAEEQSHVASMRRAVNATKKLEKQIAKVNQKLNQQAKAAQKAGKKGEGSFVAFGKSIVGATMALGLLKRAFDFVWESQAKVLRQSRELATVMDSGMASRKGFAQIAGGSVANLRQSLSFQRELMQRQGMGRAQAGETAFGIQSLMPWANRQQLSKLGDIRRIEEDVLPVVEGIAGLKENFGKKWKRLGVGNVDQVLSMMMVGAKETKLKVSEIGAPIAQAASEAMRQGISAPMLTSMMATVTRGLGSGEQASTAIRRMAKVFRERKEFAGRGAIDPIREVFDKVRGEVARHMGIKKSDVTEEIMNEALDPSSSIGFRRSKFMEELLGTDVRGAKAFTLVAYNLERVAATAEKAAEQLEAHGAQLESEKAKAVIAADKETRQLEQKRRAMGQRDVFRAHRAADDAEIESIKMQLEDYVLMRGNFSKAAKLDAEVINKEIDLRRGLNASVEDILKMASAEAGQADKAAGLDTGVYGMSQQFERDYYANKAGQGVTATGLYGEAATLGVLKQILEAVQEQNPGRTTATASELQRGIEAFAPKVTDEVETDEVSAGP